ncbi:hypothetical protein TWF696_004469 [Orbilia brochopaga]|uniref:Uncharacterized protein n=1 Tax=Orbilia brochopaga TaxID=3140254 RepID=A0AAV9V8N7_9PEZI
MSGFGSSVRVPELVSSRSLSDLQGEQRGENRATATRPPTRTVSLASAPQNGFKVPLFERPVRDLAQLQALLQPPPTQTDRLIIAPLRAVDSLPENQSRSRMPSGASDSKDAAAADVHDEPAPKRRKENVAPVANLENRTDLESAALIVAKDFEIYEDSSLSSTEIASADMRPPTPNISAPWSPRPQDFHAAIERDVLRRADFDEELLQELRCMYGVPSESGFSHKLLRAIEDDFEAKYKAVFDVFYNTRRFFGQPCGTILDAAFAEEQVIGCGTVTGKSIYGVYIHNNQPYEIDAEAEQHCSAPPNTPNTSGVPRPAHLNSQIFRRMPSAAGDFLNVPKPRQTSESSSIVQQRISSFETPRPALVEKKYQTSPSYQLLNAIKPVRGRSLKEHFEPTGGRVETTVPVSGVTQDENPAFGAESLEPQDRSASEISSVKPTSNLNLTGEMEISDRQDTSHSVTPEQDSSANSNELDRSEGESSDLNSILHNIYDAEVEPSPLPSPDFSDPQIVTSTPDQNSCLNSPATHAHDILVSENHQDDSTQSHSIEPVSTANNLTKSPARVMQEIDGNRQALPPKTQVQSDEKSKMSEIVNELNADDNKENIAPEETDPSEPTTVYLGDRAMSLSSLSRLAQSEVNDDVPALVDKEKPGPRKNGGWPKRPLRMVRSAIDSIRVRSGESSASKEKERKKTRSSVLDLFKFARTYKTVDESDLTGTPSFRVLPTIDCPSAEPEIFRRKTKSSLSVRLDRKKKPILAVPKYPKRRRSRGNIFGLFEYGRAQKRSSFIVHSDSTSKPTTPRKTSHTSRKTFASRIARRFNMKILPLFRRRRIFSASSGTGVLEEEEEPIRFERTPSPPPRLELELPRSGL